MQSLKILFLLILPTTAMFAQDYEQLKQDIYFYSDIVANAVEPEHKVRANEILVPLVEKALAEKIDVDFSRKRLLSNISSPDSTFSILTWPVKISESSHKYSGYIIRDEKITKLNDEAAGLLENITHIIADKDNWFGQMYYSIEAFKEKGKTKYVLFGINAYTEYEDIKMADILDFDEQGNPIFGQQLFAKDAKDLRDAKNRIVLKYSDDSPVNLNYNPGLGMIVYDHLVPRMGQLSGQGITLTGDGSYEGYQWSEGVWLHKEKLFNHVYEEAPRPTPVLDGNDENTSKKDLFGKPRKK